jgi:uncharacterized protein (DUF2235 family)
MPGRARISPMANIVICCDGTWNTPDQLDKGVPAPTNVSRLYSAIADFDDHQTKQELYYHRGVGASGKWWDKAIGGATGTGIDQHIAGAYQKLCYSYHPGDHIFLFGFSRGAYTVRSTVGLVGRCGLLRIGNLDPDDVWERINTLVNQGYRRKLETRTDWEERGWGFHNEPGEAIPIHFIGVWDTVGALGIPDDMALLNLIDDRRRYSFHDTQLNSNVATARHAVAMDERRASFQPTLWTDAGLGCDLKQLWFPGVHADVGGGYLENGLADAALLWMINEAAACGLKFSKAIKQINPNHHDMMHDSCEGIFGVLPTQPRSIPNLKNEPSAFHTSALQRQDDPPITQSPYRRAKLITPLLPIVIDIHARLAWNETGIWLEAGVKYTFEASGQWLDGTVKCGPGGTRDGNFHAGELLNLVGSALDKLETWYGRLVKNPEVNFPLSKRHRDYQWFALIGAIANGQGIDGKDFLLKPETFLIGEGCSYTPKKSGYFYAYTNDAWNCYENNAGHVALTIS